MDDSPSYRPLYRQVYDYLVRQIAEGGWQPGEVLPSEQALAGKLHVSQGTVRKALDVLGTEKLIERRQGKGTFVAEHTQERAMFRFFRLSRPGGARCIPTTTGETLRRRSARSAEAQKLKLEPQAQVVELNRIRMVDGDPAVLEKIVVPLALFPDIEKRAPLPNALYSLYQRQYGLNIVATEEELHADVARSDEAKRLRIKAGTPILHIERIAVALDGTRVEWRISRCDTRRLVYAVTLS